MYRFRRILCYAGNETNQAALSRAASLAIANRAQLTVMDVITRAPRGIGALTDGAVPEGLEDLVVEERRVRLNRRVADISDTAIPVEVVVGRGDPATEIIRRVIADRMDLVIKSAAGSGGSECGFGSVARTLLRICPCPVWVLKPEIHGRFDCVLAAIDLDAEDDTHLRLNHDILDCAYSVAQGEDAQLHIVSAWDLWMEGTLRKRVDGDAVDRMIGMQESKIRRSLDDLLQSPLSQDQSIHIHLIRGKSSQAIRTVADEISADLMVMGTVCRTGVPGFLMGNTAEALIPDLNCSMLALKPAGFVTPVQLADSAVGPAAS